MARLTHVDESGKARMVDVAAKQKTMRRALAHGIVRFNARAFDALAENRLEKGDALAVARIAGIQAAKRTADWIPLCHTVALESVAVNIKLDAEQRTAEVLADACAHGRTGVEMEALVAVNAACLALYDMAKALDRGICIERIELLEKSGGRSGDYRLDRTKRR